MLALGEFEINFLIACFMSVRLPAFVLAFMFPAFHLCWTRMSAAWRRIPLPTWNLHLVVALEQGFDFHLASVVGDIVTARL